MVLDVGYDSRDDDGGGVEGGLEWADEFISLRDESEGVCARQAGSERSRRDLPNTSDSLPTRKAQRLTQFSFSSTTDTSLIFTFRVH
jgi:hypothetical protein